MKGRLFLHMLVGSLVVGCTRPAPLVPPQPARLTTARPVAESIRLAARALIEAGFEVTTADEASGVLTARLVRSPENHGTALACSYERTSAPGRGGRSTYTVSLVARPVGSVSEVTIAPRVVTEYSQLPRLMGAQFPESETDCVSSGEIERRLAAALTAVP